MGFLGIPIVEWVGYLAMAVVLVSFLMKSIVKLRLVNASGALLFIVYGCMLQPLSKPIIITNAVIFGIHLYYLYKKRK